MIWHKGKKYSGISKKPPTNEHPEVWEVSYNYRGEQFWHNDNGHRFWDIDKAIAAYEYWYPRDVAEIDKDKENEGSRGFFKVTSNWTEKEGIERFSYWYEVKVKINDLISIRGCLDTYEEAVKLFEREKEIEATRQIIVKQLKENTEMEQKSPNLEAQTTSQVSQEDTLDSTVQQDSKRGRRRTNKPFGVMVKRIRKFIRLNIPNLDLALTGVSFSVTQTNKSYHAPSALVALRHELKTSKKYKNLVVSMEGGNLTIGRSCP